jgi:hypothetical protein
MGTPITALVDRQRMVDNNARRLEVLRNCINFLFDNKISDARIVSGFDVYVHVPRVVPYSNDFLYRRYYSVCTNTLRELLCVKDFQG